MLSPSGADCVLIKGQVEKMRVESILLTVIYSNELICVTTWLHPAPEGPNMLEQWIHRNFKLRRSEIKGADWDRVKFLHRWKSNHGTQELLLPWRACCYAPPELWNSGFTIDKRIWPLRGWLSRGRIIMNRMRQAVWYCLHDVFHQMGKSVSSSPHPAPEGPNTLEQWIHRNFKLRRSETKGADRDRVKFLHRWKSNHGTQELLLPWRACCYASPELWSSGFAIDKRIWPFRGLLCRGKINMNRIRQSVWKFPGDVFHQMGKSVSSSPHPTPEGPNMLE